MAEMTAERRQHQSDVMRKRHAERKAAATSLPSLPAPPDIDEAAPVLNPPVNPDLVRDPPPTPRAVRPPRAARPSPAEPSAESFPITAIVDDLASLPLDDISYADCGSLINACSAAITALTTARFKRFLLEAGTHRAPCATCGRSIDISKSGGFQILTVRDEHFQPQNIYFCSQGCLLARNMPSHAKSEAARLARDRKPK